VGFLGFLLRFVTQVAEGSDMRSGALTVRWWSAVVAGVLFTSLLVLTGGGGKVDLRQTSGLTYLCTGYAGCKAAGYSDAGYGAVNSRMYWRMYPGHNCVNYVAYRMIKAGMSATRPWTGSGNAANWGHAMASITNQKPAVGAVAWYDAYHHVGSAGHVAYVEKVNSPTDIVISEDSWGGTFHWQHITTASGFWPSGFIHFRDKDLGPVLKNTVAPTVSGTPQVGQKLTANHGKWSGGPTVFHYRWTADGSVIPGKVAHTFVPTADQVGKKIGVVVTATHPKSTKVAATSDATDAVAEGAFKISAKPSYSGVPVVGDTLKASPGTWLPSGESYTYDWQSDRKDIPGATGPTLSLTPDLVGHKVRLITYASAAGFRTASRGSVETTVLKGQVKVAEPFTISGAARPGQTLTVTGSIEPTEEAITPAYQWYSGGQPIAGAKRASYRVRGADLGKHITVRVVFAAPGYLGATVHAGEPNNIRTPGKITIKTAGAKGRAAVRVRVAAWHVQHLSAKVRVRIADQIRFVKLVNGTALVRLTGLRPGRRAVYVHLYRSASVGSAQKNGYVRIR